MKVNAQIRASIDDEGRLILPPGLASQYGLTPGIDVYVDEGRSGLAFYPSLTNLAKIYIEPTNRCNLECRTCIRHSWEEPLGHMNEETFRSILQGLRAVDPVPTVFFGGFGEPLAHPRIIEMISEAKSLGAPVELITNGTLLTERMSMELIRAGLDRLWVSLDGATPESYTDVRLGAALPEVLSNVRTLVSLRGSAARMCSSDGGSSTGGVFNPEIGIVFVAMRRNLSDLPSVVLLGTRLGATRFMVTNVLPYTAEMRKEALYTRSLADRAFNPDSFYKVELPKMDIDPETAGPLFGQMPGGHAMTLAGTNYGESVNRCPFVDKGATAIAWDGSLVPCLPLLHDHTSFLNRLERVSKRHVIGNVNERSLTGLWNDLEYLAFRDRVQRFDFSPCCYCGGCDLSEKNEEDCAGNTFPTCGGCLWAQGVIQCP
jgi:MoaA/NifB/PqqE/SkfB family radical SAM enzyme